MAGNGRRFCCSSRWERPDFFAVATVFEGRVADPFLVDEVEPTVAAESNFDCALAVLAVELKRNFVCNF